MKTVLLTQDFPPRPGGMSRYYADLAAGLGTACKVATGNWQGAPPTQRGDYQIVSLPFDAAASHRPWNLLRTGRRIERILREDGTDVLLGGNIRPFGLLAERLSRRTRVRLGLIYHGSDLLRTSRRWKNHALKRRRWRKLVEADAVHIVNSNYTAGIAQSVGFPAARLAVVPPEVDTEHFKPAENAEQRRTLREQLGWRDDEVVTLFVGRLIERKGLADLLTALGGLPRHVRLVVAGSGDAGSWQARARERALGDRVNILGPRSYDELPALYRAADIFAGPSRDMESQSDVESFGIVFLEAAASGLPVLATKTGGIPESVEEGVGGILVPPQRPDELGRAWLRLVEDGPLRAKLGEGGRTGRAQSHGPGSSARRLREVMESGTG